MSEIGTLLKGKYRVGVKIGQGGMGEVYQGQIEYPMQQSRPCAIKFIGEDVARDTERVAMFAREALIAMDASCDHHNLITVRDFDALPDGRLFLVMDYVDGPALWEVAPELRDQYPIIRAIAESMILALATMHAHGVTHRDVAPPNILLARDGIIKLADFSLARHDYSESSPRGYGRLFYAAPEVLRGVWPDEAADLYAVGVVLHELIVGQPLRGKVGPGAMASLPESTPADLLTLITGLLAPDPDERLTAAKAVAILYDSDEPIATRRSIAAFLDQWCAQMADTPHEDREQADHVDADAGDASGSACQGPTPTLPTLFGLAARHLAQTEQQGPSRPNGSPPRPEDATSSAKTTEHSTIPSPTPRSSRPWLMAAFFVAVLGVAGLWQWSMPRSVDTRQPIADTSSVATSPDDSNGSEPAETETPDVPATLSANPQPERPTHARKPRPASTPIRRVSAPTEEWQAFHGIENLDLHVAPGRGIVVRADDQKRGADRR